MNQNLYVAGGSGRSGSTLIGEVFAAATDRIMLGEIALIWRALVDDLLCGCGEATRTCPFWASVLEELDFDVDERAPRLLHLFQDLLQRSLRPHKPMGSEAEWSEAHQQLLGALRTAAPQGFVDTSKQPPYLLFVAEADTTSKYVHIARDPRAVAYSWSISKPATKERGRPMRTMSPAKSSAAWVLHHRSHRDIEGSFAAASRRTYESFAESPGAWAADTLAQLGEQPTAPDVMEQLAQRRFAPQANHAVAGNPGRFMSGAAAIQPDQRWLDNQRPNHSRIAWGVAAIEARHYGYSMRPGPSNLPASTSS